MLINFREILINRDNLASLIYETLVMTKSSMHTNFKTLSLIVTSRYFSYLEHSTYEDAHDDEIINAHNFLETSINRDNLMSCINVILRLIRRS